MITLGQVFRTGRIVRVLIAHGLVEFVEFVPLVRPLQAVLSPFARKADGRDRGVRLREALEELGPIFVKFGQLLSARPDLVPEDIATELTRLQDQVPPFPGGEARAIIERAYGAPLETHLIDFQEQPVASASVAQVHAARLHDGTEVMVKVLRPGIDRIISHDLELLYTLARLAQRYWSEGPRLRPLEVVEDYDKTIHDELDFMREAANASQLRANFESSELIYVPEVYWDHTRRNVLVLERIGGIPIRDVAAIRAAGVDMRRLAHDGVEIFFTQAFRDGFFHADMHPGNIFVSETGQYRAVDFGIMGTLSDADKRYLAEMFLAFFNRDYRQVAEAHVRAGWVPPGTRVEEFEAAIRTVCEPVFARPISEISFGRFVMHLFQTARRFNMPVQPQLVLLQKTLLQIEGLGRMLYPELDLWDTAKPFLERWMHEQLGPRAAVRALRRELPKWLPLIPELPALSYELLRRLQNPPDTVGVEDLERLRAQVRAGQRRMFYAVLGGTLVLGALVAATLGGETASVFNDRVAPWVMGIVGGVLLAASWPRQF